MSMLKEMFQIQHLDWKMIYEPECLSWLVSEIVHFAWNGQPKCPFSEMNNKALQSSDPINREPHHYKLLRFICNRSSST